MLLKGTDIALKGTLPFTLSDLIYLYLILFSFLRKIRENKGISINADVCSKIISPSISNLCVSGMNGYISAIVSLDFTTSGVTCTDGFEHFVALQRTSGLRTLVIWGLLSRYIFRISFD